MPSCCGRWRQSSPRSVLRKRIARSCGLISSICGDGGKARAGAKLYVQGSHHGHRCRFAWRGMAWRQGHARKMILVRPFAWSARSHLGVACLKHQVWYRIRQVDSQDEQIADVLDELHRATFLDCAPVPSFDEGYWWLAFCGRVPVAFAGLVQSTHARNAGYLCRVGVISKHRGRSLQLRLLRAAEHRARRSGWQSVVSDTTDNVSSANNFITAGYRLYRPSSPWGWPDTLYWRKQVGGQAC